MAVPRVKVAGIGGGSPVVFGSFEVVVFAFAASRRREPTDFVRTLPAGFALHGAAAQSGG
jgi:hypothetical protein